MVKSKEIISKSMIRRPNPQTTTKMSFLPPRGFAVRPPPVSVVHTPVSATETAAAGAGTVALAKHGPWKEQIDRLHREATQASQNLRKRTRSLEVVDRDRLKVKRDMWKNDEEANELAKPISVVDNELNQTRLDHRELVGRFSAEAAMVSEMRQKIELKQAALSACREVLEQMERRIAEILQAAPQEDSRAPIEDTEDTKATGHVGRGVFAVPLDLSANNSGPPAGHPAFNPSANLTPPAVTPNAFEMESLLSDRVEALFDGLEMPRGNEST